MTTLNTQIETTIETVRIADFADNADTIEVNAMVDGISQPFYVQLTDGEFRSDLGCLILNDEGDIDEQDLPEIEIDSIIEAAEKFYAENTREIRTDYIIELNEYDEVVCIYTDYGDTRTLRQQEAYLIEKFGTVELVTKNPHFINSATSGYETEYSDVIETFDTVEDALSYLEENC